MLNENDIQLFYKLLDSLSSSLSSLGTKYELLVREMSERSRIENSLNVASNQIPPILNDVSRELENVQNEIKSIRVLCEKSEGSFSSLRDVLDHVDKRMDKHEASFDSIEEAIKAISLLDIKEMSEKLDNMAEEAKPALELATMLKKPLTWILVAYTVIVTGIAVYKTGEWIKDAVTGKKDAAESIEKADRGRVSGSKLGTK
jgi:chromosome segregation ATPase